MLSPLEQAWVRASVLGMRFRAVTPGICRAFLLFAVASLGTACATIEVNPGRARLAHHSAAIAAEAAGNDVEAEKRYLKALASTERALGPSHQQTAVSLNNLAVFYISRKRYEEAKIPLTRALEIREAEVPVDHAALARQLTNAGQISLNTGNFTKADSFYRRALAEISQAPKIDNDTRGRALMGMGHAQRKNEREELALRYYWRALPYIESGYGMDSPVMAELLHYVEIEPPRWLRLDPARVAKPGVNVGCPPGTSMRRYSTDRGEVAQCEEHDGTVEGVVLSYNLEGQLSVLSEQQGGTPHGLTTEWHPGGHMRQSGFWRMGKREGAVFEWHESGLFAAVVEYQGGRKHGVQTDYDPSGRILAQANFTDGVQNGAAMSFYPNGLRRASGAFKNGKPDGVWTYYDENGEVRGTVGYRDGVELPAGKTS